MHEVAAASAALALIALCVAVSTAFALTVLNFATSEYQPVFWPANPVYFACLWAPLSIHAFLQELDIRAAAEKKHARPQINPFYPASILAGMCTVFVSAKAMLFFLTDDMVYDGGDRMFARTTYPFAGVAHVGLMPAAPNRNSVDARFAGCIIVLICSSLSVVIELILAFESKARAEDFVWPAVHVDTYHVVFTAAYGAAVVTVAIELATAVLPYARWQIADSPNAAVIAGLVAVCVPRHVDPAKSPFAWFVLLLLALGVVQSALYLMATTHHINERCVGDNGTAGNDDGGCFLQTARYQAAFFNYTMPYARYVVDATTTAGAVAPQAFAVWSFVHHLCTVLLLALGCVFFCKRALDAVRHNLVRANGRAEPQDHPALQQGPAADAGAPLLPDRVGTAGPPRIGPGGQRVFVAVKYGPPDRGNF